LNSPYCTLSPGLRILKVFLGGDTLASTRSLCVHRA
jgi:hypothetical protein